MMASGNSYPSNVHNPAAYYRAAEHGSYVDHRPQEYHYRSLSSTSAAAPPQPQQHQHHHQQQQQQSWSMSARPMGGVDSVPSSSAAASNAYAPMVATGKKRKRLQRACVACHKAKRRCDGGLPCSNCDFSGRTCAYSDSQGKAVPPTKRSLRPSEAASLQQQQQHEDQRVQYSSLPVSQHSHVAPSQSAMASTYQQPYLQATSPQHQRVAVPQIHNMAAYPVGEVTGKTGAANSAARDQSQSPRSSHHSPRSSTSSSRTIAAEPTPEIRRELFSIFFSAIQPWSCLVDEMTLLRDVSSMTASPAMLFAIYALAARHAYRLRNSEQRFARLCNEVGNGLSFASEARRVLHREDPTTGLSILDGAVLELESRQALCLLACFEYECGRYQRASQYITYCCKGLLNTSSTDSRQQRHQHKQALKRVTCIAAVLDVCIATTCGRSPSLRWWDLQSAIDTMKTPSTPLLSKMTSNREEDINACLLHLLQVALLFSKTMDVYRALQFSSGSSSDARRQITACEEYLQQWADRLPNRLRFDEANLQAVERTLLRAPHDQHGDDDSDDHAHMSSLMALCWCAMHAFAESSTIALQRAHGTGTVPLAAAQNLAMILERSNVGAFNGPLSSFGIIVLRAGCAVYENERRATAMRSGAYSEDVRAGAWSDVVSATNRLQTDAGLVEDQITTAVNWLGFGATEEPAMHYAAWRTTSPGLKIGNGSISLINSAAIQKPASRESLSPVQSSASVDDAAAPSLNSRHESSASSTTGSVTSNHGASHVHQLPPLVGLPSSDNSVMRKFASATSPLIKSGNTLPPLRFPSPEHAPLYHHRK